MHYDPIKRSLGSVFNQNPTLRKLFYSLLDLLLLRSWHIHKELRIWKRSAPQSPAILDAGMGYGQYTYYLAKTMPQASVLAVDVKDEQVADCNQFYVSIGLKNAKAELAYLTDFEKPNQFDLALSVDVMEHILEDVKVFQNIHKALKPGGMLLISTPSDQGGSDVHGDDESSFIEEHVRDGYNVNDIAEKLKLAGFSKSEVRYSYGAPGKISWKLSMKYPILMLGFSKAFFILLPFYYLITYPIAFVLNFFDVNGKHKTGTGLIVKAWK